MPNNEALFVISDLHLGGDSDFQMCSSEGRSRLADFIGYLTFLHCGASNVHLVLNGDIVDFLAEKEFSSFTNDEVTAKSKLKKIIKESRQIWEGLQKFVASGARLTILLGNHDIELSLPGTRRLLLETIGPGHVSFIYDNEALVVGPLIIEHGNRYDRWNIVSHGAMRAIRSAMSRLETPIEYLGPPGSQLVKEVMNPIKHKFQFIDLLKPETSGVLPILAVLEPSAMKNVIRLSELAAKSMTVTFDKNGLPRDQQNIDAVQAISPHKDEMYKLALELVGMNDPQNIAFLDGVNDFWHRLKNAATKKARDIQLNMLLQALRAFARYHRQAFNVGDEEAEYLKAANASVGKGFKVVVYGHTHLVKHIKLHSADALYLNTGTWADLMKVPDKILSGDEEIAKKQLEAFLDDLENQRLEAWRCQVPTFAKIILQDDQLIDANVYFYDGGSNIRIVPEVQLTELDYTGGR